MKDTVQLERAHLEPKPQWQLNGRHVLLLFTAFFGLIFSVNGYMLFSALNTHTGVVAVEPYRKGLAYNDRIAAAELQSAIGWSDSASLGPSGVVIVRMAARDGTPLTGLRLKAVFGRPATAHGDRSLTFTERAPGDYHAMAGPIDAGTWLITLEASSKSDDAIQYRAKRRLWLKS